LLGEDVNNWSFTSLQEAVGKYKKSHDNGHAKGDEGHENHDNKNLGSDEDLNGKERRERVVSYEDHATNMLGMGAIGAATADVSHKGVEYPEDAAHNATHRTTNLQSSNASAQIQELINMSKEMTNSITNMYMKINTNVGQQTVLTDTQDIEITVSK
jgi:hypothetical protein